MDGPTDESVHVNRVWQYPLFEALYGRRSRRFGMGFELDEGPFHYKSEQPPLPLDPLEEALLVAAGMGISGTVLSDLARPGAMIRGAGRTFGSALSVHRTQLFLTNDSGVYVMDLQDSAARRMREVESEGDRSRVVSQYLRNRRKLRDGRLDIPRRAPPMFAHNYWDNNRPGCTLFMPVCDVSASLINLTIQMVDGEGGRFAGGTGGGFYVVDDRYDFRPAGTQEWADSGFLDKKKALPLSVLEREAVYFTFNEAAIACQNMFLATEAMGLGGWMHCGFLSLEVLEELGFRTVAPKGMQLVRNPVGMDGVFEGYCPPYFSDMDAAVDSIIAGTRGGLGEFLERGGQVPHTISDEQYESGIPDTSPEGEACAKSVCNYIYDTYGKFPGTVDTMHLMWFMQVHHLDLDFYDKFFKPGAYSQTHRDHLSTWHPDFRPAEPA